MEEIIVFATLGLSLLFFIWGKIRYDLVALSALILLAILGLVPYDEAFMGFSHPAVITVAAILVVSKGLENSGIVNVLVAFMDKVGNNITLQIATLSAAVAIASGFMNNIGALAIFMPVAIQMARKHNYSPSLILMPIAFASLLGGLTTLIGTPPNIIVASFRAQSGEVAFGMFDFTVVGMSIAAAGVLFISLVGYRLIPKRTSNQANEALFKIENYITEVIIPSNSPLENKAIKFIIDDKELDVKALGIVRNKIRIHAPSRYFVLMANDIIVLESNTDDLEEFVNKYQVKLVGDEELIDYIEDENEIINTEGILQESSPLIGQTASSIHMRSRYDVNLLALSRGDRTLIKRIDHEVFRSGDVLLLQLRRNRISDTLNEMKCFPLAKRSIKIGKPRRTLLAVGLFALSIIAVVMGWLPVAISFTLAAMGMVVSRILPLNNLYTSIDWPVIVLLGAMIPVGEAFETSGAATTVTKLILSSSDNLPAWALLGLIMLTTMLLSALINNAATVVLMAPIGLQIASVLELSADPFLMSIAVGASSSFLSPIGHQSNTLVLGPGGYQFGDYWKPGLPLSLLVMAVGIPVILWVWPL
ncbi:SLC13 family permease [Cyclobacterium amurskyense]|uniref:TrkA-C domain protein n=1 Tax=Cyclobacterium amurskyense TaxID=320787 RepID=A0A0H4PJW6_9BACT|nr:SLC13 family permease [Cyclobacterium amurskyense]AKP53253.1 TrkA-C domain protein [Cyclobacterium amurskyense]|tara:strand:+ start:16037 stop:17806 length:1770 start_codon:yes stop_codon:yes gene_type:complete